LKDQQESDNQDSDSESLLDDIDIEIDNDTQQVESASEGISIDEEIEALTYPENNFASQYT
jgi:hypothetical protein